VTIELCRAGSEKIKFMEIKLKDCLISAIAMNAGACQCGDRLEPGEKL